jgi:hypothetical protein
MTSYSIGQKLRTKTAFCLIWLSAMCLMPFFGYDEVKRSLLIDLVLGRFEVASVYAADAGFTEVKFERAPSSKDVLSQYATMLVNSGQLPPGAQVTPVYDMRPFSPYLGYVHVKTATGETKVYVRVGVRGRRSV